MAIDKGSQKETVTLPLETIALVEAMAAKGVLGGKKAAIFRHLILTGVEKIINDEYVSKHLATKKLLEDE